MIINHNTLKTWNPRACQDELEMDVSEFDAEQYEELNNKLLEYIESQPYIDEVMLTTPHAAKKDDGFSTILKTLSATSLRRLTLKRPDTISISEHSRYEEDIKAALSTIPFYYPVILSPPPSAYDAQADYPNSIIRNMQNDNQARLRGEPSTRALSNHLKKDELIQDDPPIPLKKIMHATASLDSEFDAFISVEAQHVEEEEEEEQQNIAENIDEAVTLTAEEENQSIHRYKGELINFESFQKEPYLSKVHASAYPEIYDVFKYEFFGDAYLPKSIHCLSPEAANYIAEHAGALSTLNEKSLPNHLVLKKTDNHLFVLDYDPQDTADLLNPWIPKVIKPYRDKEPLYDIKLPETTEKIIQQLGFTEHIASLHNVWIRYGDFGVELLLSHIKKLDESHPGLSEFIIEHYLKKFPHWDQFLDDHGFLDTLTQIREYDETKLQCLKEFLEQTDNTQFSFMETVHGFEAFWSEWSLLAKKNNLALHDINSRCAHRPCGSPLVYMERLITILKNARNVKEQLNCFHDVRTIVTMENHSISSDSINIMHFGFKPRHDKIFFIKNQYYVQIRDRESGPIPPYGYMNQKYKNTRNEWIPLDREIVENASLTFSSDQHKHHVTVLDDSVEHATLNQHIRKKLYGRKPYSLNHYGDYYASEMEGFRLVSNEMNLYYAGADLNPDSMPRHDVEVKNWSEYHKNLEGINSIWEIQSAFERAGYRLYQIQQLTDNETHFNNLLPDASINTKNNLFLINSFKQHLTEKELKTLSITPYNPSIFLKQQSLFMRDPISGEYENILSTNGHGYFHCPSHNYLNIDDMQRYIGQQSHSISPPVFQKAIDKLRDEGYPINDCEALALYSLFFMAHDGYQDTYDPQTFLDTFYNIRQAPKQSIFGSMIFWLRRLHERGIHLNEVDGSLICQHLERLAYSVDFQFVDFDIHQAIKQLFVAIQDNDYTILKALRLLSITKGKDAPAIFVHILDALDYFNHDTPEIKTRYRDELPLFCALLVRSGSDLYHKDTKNTKTLEQLKKIKAFLTQAAQEPLPNTYDFTIKYLIQAKQSCPPNKLLPLIDDLNALPSFAPHAIRGLLNKHALNHQASTSDAPANDNPYLVQDLESAFANLGQAPWVNHLKETWMQSNWVRKATDPEKIAAQIHELINRLKDITTQPSFIKHQEKLSAIFLQSNLKDYDFETLRQLLTLLSAMPTRDYTLILEDYFKRQTAYNAETRQTILRQIQSMHIDNLPSPLIQRLMQYLPCDQDQFNALQSRIVDRLNRKAQDPFITWMLTDHKINRETWNKILTVIEKSEADPDELCLFFTHAAQQGNLTFILNNLNNAEPDLLTLLAKSTAATPESALKKGEFNINTLLHHLIQLDSNDLKKLNQAVASSHVSLLSLDRCLTVNAASKNKDFEKFLEQLEKNPFGKRPRSHHDLSQVARVINGLVDLNQKTAYPYHYRKQMMEAFLFIDKAGYQLPIYAGKPAQELSHQQLKTLFQDIKHGKFDHLGQFNKHLYALGLMREAVYRSTGHFPYSTQMIAIIDCMMHEGHVISNIDTGQGKSLIDTLKGALLYLESDRVDISTASLVDAKRDLDTYRPFFNLLGIPHNNQPITTESTFKELSKPAVNYTTIGNMARCMESMMSEGKAPPGWDEKLRISLVLNEADYTLLDDQTIYRFATQKSDLLLRQSQEWVYESINDFVLSPQFRNKESGQKTDILNLRKHLRHGAKAHQQPDQFIHQISDQQILTWLNSAIIVNYRLKENIDYVLTEETEDRKIRGIMQKTRRAKLIMKDGKISSETQFGNGIQQLLYAKINKKLGHNAFIIEPECKNILSLNNKNMIQYYLSKQGFIWGSSATVGVGKEIDKQYENYGFEFSKVQPHQKKIVQIKRPVLLKNEKEQFTAILKQLKWDLNWNYFFGQKSPPALIMFKDIPTAQRFYQFILEKQKSNPLALQLYTGLSDEKEAVQRAATQSMITVTTSALGRNTDIPYDKTVGLTFYETSAQIPARQKIQRAGRTGRQGSKGTVHTFINQMDLKGKTFQAIQAEIEKNAEHQRDYHEKLFDILNALRECIPIKDQDQNFFKKQWSSFSEQVEIKYNETRAKKTFDIQSFLKDVVLAFNQLPSAIKTPTTAEAIQEKISQAYEKRGQKNVFEQEVTQKDCIAAEIIAYQFTAVQPIDSDVATLSQEELNKIKKMVNQLLAAPQKATQHHQAYIQYLNESPKNRQQIKATHQEVINQYLKKQTALSKRNQLIRQWLGFKSPIARLSADQHYLLLFKALMSVDKTENNDEVMFDNIKKTLETLLLEYVQCSWFVSTTKRQAMLSLITKIQDSTDLESMITTLSQSKLDMLRQDIKANKTRILPVTLFGRSRFQDKLDHAIQLTDSLITNPLDRTLIAELATELNGLKEDQTTPVNNIKTIDDFKSQNKTARYKDSLNRVITKSIESHLIAKEPLTPKGMTGNFKKKIDAQTQTELKNKEDKGSRSTNPK